MLGSIQSLKDPFLGLTKKWASSAAQLSVGSSAAKVQRGFQNCPSKNGTSVCVCAPKLTQGGQFFLEEDGGAFQECRTDATKFALSRVGAILICLRPEQRLRLGISPKENSKCNIWVINKSFDFNMEKSYIITICTREEKYKK